MKKVKKGFTLAEVLITLGVIGVVAAITIPGLITAYKAHQLKAQFLETYSIVQQVFKQMEADDVSLDPQSYNRDKEEVFYKTFNNYLTGTIDCGTYSAKGLPCYNIHDNKGYKTLNGTTKINTSLFDDGQLVLQDGTLLIFEQPSTGTVQLRIWIFVDLNGYKNPPNILGYDLFTFQFLDGELHTMGDKETTYNDINKYCNENSSNALNGIACAHKAKTETDYFKRIIKKFK